MLNSLLNATTVAAAVAALLPRPKPGLMPFKISIFKPDLILNFSRNSLATTPAVFSLGSSGTLYPRTLNLILLEYLSIETLTSS
jgi:hypothetical protein